METKSLPKLDTYKKKNFYFLPLSNPFKNNFIST